MSYDKIISKYRIDDICPEIDNELSGMFIDLFGDDFEIGIFPEESPEDSNSFVVTLEIMAEDASLNSDQALQIKSAVEERLTHNVGKEWKSVQKHFDGVQIFFNDDLLNWYTSI